VITASCLVIAYTVFFTIHWIPVQEHVRVFQISDLSKFINPVMETFQLRELYVELPLEEPLKSLAQLVHLKVNPSNVPITCKEPPVLFNQIFGDLGTKRDTFLCDLRFVSVLLEKLLAVTIFLMEA
jgi:hypothetical protein